MKNLIGLVIAFSFAFILSGCVNGPIYEKKENYSVISYANVAYEINSKAMLLEKEYKIDQENYIHKIKFYEFIKMASEKTMFENKKFFAIISNGTNNLNGFPLTNHKDLFSYCFSFDDNSSKFLDQKGNTKCEFISHRQLKFVMFKEPIPGLYLWDAKKTLDELR